jgi:DNA-binding IclR family transcriptional regulator
MSSAGLLADSPLGAVEKADLVLGSFPPGRGCVGVTELAHRCGLAKSTTHRVLQVLEAIGMVARQPTGYRLGHRLHELASIAGGGRPSQIRECVLPHLLDLYEHTHLTIHLGIWTDGEVLIADRLHGHAGQCVPPQVGSRTAAQECALGKVMLAYAPEPAEPAHRLARPRAAGPVPTAHTRLEAELRAIRQDGIAFCPDTPLPGVVCVAAPVWGPHRILAAAISVSGPRARFDAGSVIGHVRRAACAASTATRSA